MRVVFSELLHSWRHVVVDSLVGKFEVHLGHYAFVLEVVVVFDHPVETASKGSDPENPLEFIVVNAADRELPFVKELVASVT